ncbi:hypothetical protein D3C78_1464010 [compost metagenome]
MQGFDDLAAEREGKLILRTHKVEAKHLKPATGQDIPGGVRTCLAPIPIEQATVLIRLLDKHLRIDPGTLLIQPVRV